MEKEGHDERHQKRIDEQDGAGYAGVHIQKAQIERQRREREEHAEHHQRQHLGARYGQPPAARQSERAEHQDGKHIAVEKHRVGTDAGRIERQGKERVEPVGHRGDHAAGRPLEVSIHLYGSIFFHIRAAKIAQSGSTQKTAHHTVCAMGGGTVGARVASILLST